jgi:hypothetical protein
VAGDVVRFLWGQEGELREIRNERNHDYRFFYDPCLRVEREVGFDLQETRYERNASGQVTKVEKPTAGVFTELTMDARGRVIAEQHSDGTGAKFTYRKDGELVEASNDAATIKWKRDLLGRVVSETQAGVEVKSHYAGGHRTRLESTLGAAFDLARTPTATWRRSPSASPTRAGSGPPPSTTTPPASRPTATSPAASPPSGSTTVQGAPCISTFPRKRPEPGRAPTSGPSTTASPPSTTPASAPPPTTTIAAAD